MIKLLAHRRCLLALAFHRSMSRSVDHTDLIGQRREPKIGVIRAQQQAMFGARCEHAIRLVDLLGHQIVDQHPDVGLIAAQDKRILTTYLAGGIDASDQPLSGSLLIAGRSIDLTGQKQSRRTLGFERGAGSRRSQRHRIRSHSPRA